MTAKSSNGLKTIRRWICVGETNIGRMKIQSLPNGKYENELLGGGLEESVNQGRQVAWREERVVCKW